MKKTSKADQRCLARAQRILNGSPKDLPLNRKERQRGYPNGEGAANRGPPRICWMTCCGGPIRFFAFLDDLSLPCTNNQAERDLRMVKGKQKISGTVRREIGLTAFCRLRSYLSTMRKQGQGMLVALAAVFAGRPLPIAWAG